MYGLRLGEVNFIRDTGCIDSIHLKHITSPPQRTKRIRGGWEFGIIGTELPKLYRNLFMYATTVARMLLAPKWKEAEVPAKEEWIQKPMEYAEMAKLTGRIRNQDNKLFIKEWKWFIEYLQINCKQIKTLAGLL
ncbi:Hypothetical predicted protein [Podarcis lilfordi]|uniref:Uncharacterized protein n=1 Tax=Podarcis lilfordi TaxID=74358 RepID=A0AA35KT89_9SAUR|nr:Hypothetical predicted protein [Podarcis lilfordi]